MGEYPADKEAIGSFEYYPNDGGFPAMYFPYKNQKGSEMKTGLKMGLGTGANGQHFSCSNFNLIPPDL